MSNIDPLSHSSGPELPVPIPPINPVTADDLPPRERILAGEPSAIWHGPNYPDREPGEALVLPPRKPHPHLGWAILWMIGFMFVSQVGGGIIAALLFLAQLLLAPNRDELLKEGPEKLMKSPQVAQMMWPGMLIVELITIVFGLAALRFIAGPAWPRKVALRLPSLPHLGLVLLVVPAFVLIGTAVDQIAKQYVPSLINLDETMALIGYWPWWIGVLIIGFGPGIGEELFCRAFLGRGLVGNHGVVLGVLFTSVLFGLMHIEPRQVIYAPVMGILLHFVYLTTRSLLMPMLIHMLNNSLSVLLVWATINNCLPASLAGLDNDSPQASFLWVYAGAVVLMAAVCFGLYFSRARLAAADGGPLLPWTPGYPGVDYPPPNCGTVVVHPVTKGLAGLYIGLFGFLVFGGCCVVTYLLS